MGESSLKQKRRGMFAERVSGRNWSGCCLGNRKEEKMDKIEKQTFYRKLMGLVLPIALQQFLLACVSAADALMLGYLDQDAMSAVSLAGQVTFVFNLFVAALTIGGSMFAAQYWGKGEKSMVEEILGLILRVALLVSFLFTAATLFVPELLMEFFTKEPALIVYGSQYLRIVSPSYLLCGASQMYLCIMKNSGRAFQSTVISGTMEAADIVMNLVLIYGLFGMPKMGVAGAALSTVVAKAVELLWAMADSRPSGRIHLRLSCLLHPDGELRRRFWKYTTPVLGNELVWGCGFAMYSVIMGHLGSDAVAANSVANVVKNLVVCVCLGIGTGGGILVGNELGAGALERAKRYGDKLCHFAIIAGAISGLVILFLIPVVRMMGMLTPSAQSYLDGMLVMCTYYMIGKSVNSTVIAGIFCAGGDSRFGFLCDAVTMWCVTVPLGFLSAFVLDLPVLAVFFIINLDEIVKLPAVYRHYKKYLWVKDLTQKESAQPMQ